MDPSRRTPLVLSGPAQPVGKQFFDEGRQTSTVVSISCLADVLGLGRVGMNDIGQSFQANAGTDDDQVVSRGWFRVDPIKGGTITGVLPDTGIFRFLLMSLFDLELFAQYG